MQILIPDWCTNTKSIIQNRGVVGNSGNAAVLYVAFYFILSLEISVP